MMDHSGDERAQSSSEHTPLLGNSQTSYRTSSPFPAPSASIFSCAVVCILVTELCERLTFYGIQGNLVLFATEKEQLDFTPSTASILAYLFQGTCFMLPVFGGWLADAVTGKFPVIFFGGIVYLIGAALLPVGSLVEHDKEYFNATIPSLFAENRTFKSVIYISGLFLVAIGTGAIKSNVSPFGADQVNHLGPGAVEKFFIWFYWFINIGAFFAFTFVVYVQQEYSYCLGYIIPAGSIIIALIIFVIGKNSYHIRQPTGSVFTTTMKIVNEAVRKSRRPMLSGAYVHHWLDRAKVTFGGHYSSWEVEDVKKVYQLVPIFGTFILYWTVYAQMNTAMVYQGEYMDIELPGTDFQIPIASLSILDTIGVLVLIPVMDKIVYPLLDKCGMRLSRLQRIGIGMIIAAASMVCAGGIELYRIDQCCKNQSRTNDVLSVSNMTILYQIPQYTLIGLSEVFTSVTGLEMAYVEAPKSLQSVIMGVFLLTTGLGTYLGVAIVSVTNAISGSWGKEEKWYPDKDYVNEGKLARYFFLLAGLMFLNFIGYIFVAFNFKAKKLVAQRSTSSSNGLNSSMSYHSDGQIGP